MKIRFALPMFIFLVGILMLGSVCAEPSSGQMTAPEQPFSHPANDASYGREMRNTEQQRQPGSADDGKVRYVSGGIGEGELNALESEANAYNLKMLFVAEGKYLADVSVRIIDQKGNKVLDAVADGPLLLVKLPPGRYSFEAKGTNGFVLKDRVEISGDRRASYVLRFPASEL